MSTEKSEHAGHYMFSSDFKTLCAHRGPLADASQIAYCTTRRSSNRTVRSEETYESAFIVLHTSSSFCVRSRFRLPRRLATACRGGERERCASSSMLPRQVNGSLHYHAKHLTQQNRPLYSIFPCHLCVDSEPIAFSNWLRPRSRQLLGGQEQFDSSREPHSRDFYPALVDDYSSSATTLSRTTEDSSA